MLLSTSLKCLCLLVLLVFIRIQLLIFDFFYIQYIFNLYTNKNIQ